MEVALWARLAEIAVQYLQRGSPVFIEGRLQLDTWEDKQSGQKRSKLRVIGENLQLVGDKPSSGPEPAPGQGASAQSTFRRAAPDPHLDVD